MKTCFKEILRRYFTEKVGVRIFEDIVNRNFTLTLHGNTLRKQFTDNNVTEKIYGDMLWRKLTAIFYGDN